MRGNLMKFLKRLTVASVLALGVAGGLGMTATTAHAGYSDRAGDDEPDFGDAPFIPGKKWYVLNEEVPASVVVQVQREIGKQLCKIEISPGRFVSNLKPCPDDHPFMYDPAIGLLRPKLDSGNSIGDWIDRNYAYDMRPTHADVSLARRIQRAYNTHLASLQTPRKATTRTAAVADATPQRVVTPEARQEPVQRVAEAAPRREVPAYVRARLRNALAGLTAKPDAQGRFRRGGDVFQLRQTADASSLYAFRYDPFGDRQVIAFNASVRGDGTVKLTGDATRLARLDTGTLVAFGAAVETPAVLVAETGSEQRVAEARAAQAERERLIAAAKAEALRVAQAGQFQPDMRKMMSAAAAGDATEGFVPWSKERVQQMLDRASRFVKTDMVADATPVRERTPDVTVKDAVVLPSKTARMSPRKPFEIVAADVSRVLPGNTREEHFVRVLTDRNELIDIAKEFRHANGEAMAFKVTKTPTRERYATYDIAQNPALRFALA